MHRSRVSAVVIDCHDMDTAVAFWTGALGATVQGGDETYTFLGTAIGGLHVLLQRVPETKTAKNHVHLDFETDDLEAEIQRLERLGGRRVERHERWQVMADPCGNEFCVTRAHTPDFAEHSRTWDNATGA